MEKGRDLNELTQEGNTGNTEGIKQIQTATKTKKTKGTQEDKTKSKIQIKHNIS